MVRATPPHGESQERGNSGVFLMTHYEVQVLDSYNNDNLPGRAGRGGLTGRRRRWST